ncbi:hypothetical protein IID20_04780 [Patescibacteria group bacterium]|nr:hypothetical protein [Patescibacteria group bacterium]
MTEDLIIKKLRFGRWYLGNKEKLYRMLISFFAILAAIFWFFSLYYFILYINFNQSHEMMLQELTRDKINYVFFHQRFAPTELIINEQFLIDNLDSKYDFVVKVENSNDQWRVSNIEYYFSWDGGRTEIRNDFILPNQKKYFFVLGEKVLSRPSNPEIIILKVDWRRIRSAKQLRLKILSQLKVSEVKLNYVVPEQKMISLPKISWSIKNNSIYSFWQVNFVITLYQGNQLVGINALPVKKLWSNEERAVEFMWPAVPVATEISVTPILNVFDQSNFILPR